MYNGNDYNIYENNKEAEAEFNTKKIVLNTMNDLINIPIQQLRTAQLKNFCGTLFEQLYQEAMAIEHNQDIKVQNNSYNGEIKNTPKKKDEKIKNLKNEGQKPIFYKLVKKGSNKSKEKQIKKNNIQQKVNGNKSKSTSTEKNKIVKIIKKKVVHKSSLNETDLNANSIPNLIGNSSLPKNKINKTNPNENTTKINVNSKNKSTITKNNQNKINNNKTKKLASSNNTLPKINNMIININDNNNNTSNIINNTNNNTNSNEININKIIFSIKYNTKFGEEVGILGSIPELGNWNQNQIFYLHWNNGNVWTGEILIGPNPLSDFEFKFIISSNRCVKIWESGDNNKVNFDKLFNEIKYKKNGFINKYQYSFDSDKEELLLKCKWD